MAETNRPLANRILIGLVIGVILGLATLGIGKFVPGFVDTMRKVSTAVFDPFGQIFLRMLFFVVIPLVFASLAAGVLQLGQLDRLGPLAGRTFTLFFLNMAIGVALGLVMMNVLEPGNHLDPEAKTRLMQEFGGAAQKHVESSATAPKMSFAVIVEMFMPRNLFGAVVGQTKTTIGDVLPLILFALLVGAVGTQLSHEKQRQLQGSLDLVSELMTGIVNFALKLAPYAVPAMIYSVIVKIGIEILIALGVFVLGCVAVMLLHLFGTMSLWIKYWAKRSPAQVWRDMRAVLITAFSTSSSNATLPAALACAKDTLKLKPSVAGFVLPLGTTMNMSGTALYEGCVVLFVAQVFGVDLSAGQQITLLLLSVLSAVAVAGIPGGSLPLIAGLLVTFGIPPEGIGIVLGADRILDMTRTMVNVGSDVVTTIVVDHQTPASPAETEPPAEA
ncbi:MAG: dicarboxylate/amino acid:cation symporter [Opitutaceae bacterium]|nr:dicarboxylate/amino acid:cation symporter [Opitutaceae bacterium]